jgi:porin
MTEICRLFGGGLAMIILVLSAPSEAQKSQVGITQHSHLHAPGETNEDHGSFVLDVAYSGEVNSVVSGGVQRDARYLDNLDIVAEADLDALVGWTGASALAYGLYNNGTAFSPLVGDAQVTSNIDTGVRAFRLYEAWIDQKFGSVASLRIGLYDVNSEFDALDASGLFKGSAHGIGTDISQSGLNGPSIFPVTSLAARLDIKPIRGWVMRAAILDGVPGDPDQPQRTAILLPRDDGVLVIGEVETPLPSGKLLFGHWRYTAAFDRFDGSRGRGSSGFYLRGEHRLAHERDDPDQGLAGFFRLGIADGRVNPFDRFISAGFNYRGPFKGRDGDQLGLAVAAAFTSRNYRLSTPAGRSEVAFELTYRAPLTDWLTLQPDVQYIVNPGPTPGIRDALVIGLRFEIGWRLAGKR